MSYFYVLMLTLVMCAGDVWAGNGALSQNIRHDHFAFQLPGEFRLLEEEDSSLSLLADTPWGRLHGKRVKDLDEVFVAERGGTLIFLGLEVRSYRKRFRKAIPYEEFASPQNIETYKEALVRQLEGHGLTGVSFKEPVSNRDDGVVKFECEFQSSPGHDAEEYYASVLGSHEVVYLILFSCPPMKSSQNASLFGQIVDSVNFEENYEHRPYPQNWWDQRTWGERVEDVLKLSALFFILFLGSYWGLESFLKPRLGIHPRVLWVMSLCLSFFVCLAVFKWVDF